MLYLVVILFVIVGLLWWGLVLKKEMEELEQEGKIEQIGAFGPQRPLPAQKIMVSSTV